MINILGHVANLFYALGFLIKDLLGLRLIMSVAIVIEIIYSYYVAERPLWTNIIWCCVYLVVNGYQIVSLLMARRPLVLTADEQLLFEKVFYNLSVRDFLRVLRSGTITHFEAGEVLVKEEMPIDKLILIIDGSCGIDMQKKIIARISEFTFIGEMGFLTDDPASATVRTEVPCRCVVWDAAELRALMKNDSSINVCMHAIFTSDIITKLKKQNRDLLVQLCSI
jgi:hypothetical protein